MPHLRFLGGAVVEDDSGAVSRVASRRPPLALLALLATAPARTLSRGKLLGLIWPDAREKTARNRLGTALHQARKAVGEGAIASVGDDLRLGGDALTCDVWRFREAAEAGSHERAVDLYAGPFLDGFRLEGSSAFEKRVDRIRDRLRRSYRSSLEELAEDAEERGDPATAADWWRELALDRPYDTRITLRHVRALADAGSRAEALRAARDHEQLLAEELGTDPGEEFRAAVEELRAGSGDGREAGDAPPVRSVAVLPFDDLTGAEEAELFASGLHDDLITELSRLSGLTVISRTSVLRFRDADRPVPDLAWELGVGSVVEGAVRTAGDRVRLNVQLLDARRDAHRWAESFERELTLESVFEVQRELAERIAGTLREELTPGEPSGSGRQPPEGLEAYRLYVQGRALADQRTEDEVRRSVDYFRRALGRDEAYGLAWSGLADALSLLEFYDFPAPSSAPDPLDAARRAVEESPDSGEAHASLGIALSVRRRGGEALRELEEAVQLTPGHAEAHAWLGWLRLMRGEPESAVEAAERSVELNPLAPAFRSYLAEAYLAAGDSADALTQARRARKLQAEYGLAHYVEALVLHHRGRLEEAAARADEALRLVPPRGTPTRAEVRALLAVVRAASGDTSGAERLLRRVREDGHRASAGVVRAALGDADGALDDFGAVERWDSFATEHVRYFFPDVLGRVRADDRYGALVGEIDRAWG